METNLDTVLFIDRGYLEEDLENIESDLVNENGEIDDATFEAVSNDIQNKATSFIRECCFSVESRLDRIKRNEGAEKMNLYYRVYLKNDIATLKEYTVVGLYTNLPDARDFIKDHGNTLFDHYKISEVKNGIEGGKDYYENIIY